MRILVIESSARQEGSYTRQLTRELIDLLQTHRGPLDIVARDLSRTPVPTLADGVVQAIRTRPEQLGSEQKDSTALSDALIDEIKAADLVVIGAPMYNWGVPAALKAWIDHVVRIGMTFEHGASGAYGLLGNKPAVVVVARGGNYSIPERAHLDFQKPYLAQVLKLIGLDVAFVTVDGTLLGAEHLEKSLATAREAIHRLAVISGDEH